MSQFEYKFWISRRIGLIRRGESEKGLHYPEVIVQGAWSKGDPYVMDAITGMGEDAYSCGEMAHQVSTEDALKKGEELGIDIYSPTGITEFEGSKKHFWQFWKSV